MSTLNDIPKENHFKTPEGYFDHLPVEILDRVRACQGSKEQFFLLRPSFWIPSVSIVSAILVMVMLFTNPGVTSNDMLSDHEVQQIIDSPERYDIDEAAITDAYLSSAIPDDAIKVETNIQDDEIKSYLEQTHDLENLLDSVE